MPFEAERFYNTRSVQRADLCFAGQKQLEDGFQHEFAVQSRHRVVENDVVLLIEQVVDFNGRGKVPCAETEQFSQCEVVGVPRRLIVHWYIGGIMVSFAHIDKAVIE